VSDTVALASPGGRVLLATVVLGSAVAMLTATVVNVALPTLAADLGASSAGQTWVVNAYTLTLASLVLIGGALGDRFGRVAVYRVGVVWFAVASLLCAIAWDVPSLVAFRLLQGIGGALLTPGSLAIIQSTLRPEDRGRGVGVWSGIGGIAGAVGPLLGGLLVEVSWRWVFVVNLPVAVAAVVLSSWVPESRDARARDTSIDVGGAVVTVVVLGSLTYGLIEGPNGGFATIEVLALAAAVAGVVVLGRVERGRDHAMVPLELFANRTFAVTNGLTFTVYGGMGVLFFLLAVQLQVTAGWTAVEAGTGLLPVTLILLVLSPRVGALTTRIGARWPLTVGPLVVAAGMLLATRIGPKATFLGQVLPAMAVFGLGLAAIVAPVTSTALGAVPDDRAGSASGVNNAVARTGGLLAVAAIPSLVGITGDGLSDPSVLGPGFDRAMVVAAVIVAGSGIAAFVLLTERDVGATVCEEGAERIAQHPCPVDGTPSSVLEPAAGPGG
jgi:EmrB/QacA subfamily drug resistance transporter